MTQSRLQFSSCIVLLLLSTGCKTLSRQETPVNASTPVTGSPLRVSSADVDASEPATAASPDGSIYIVWVEHRGKDADVMVARADKEARIQSPAVRVNPTAGEATAWRGDPPTIAVASDGTLYVDWTGKVETPSGHATNIYLSTSRDQGKSFSPPVKINDDAKPGVHGMHSLALGPDGRVYAAWLDERNISEPKGSAVAEGHHMESNRELFVAFSQDGGRHFSKNKSIATNVCPCCKSNLTVANDGHVYLSWRQVLPGDFRHIAVASSNDGGQTFGPSVIVSDDQWMIKGCPVSGAALSADSDGVLHVLWYAGGENGAHGIYHSESRDGGKTFAPRQLLAASSAHGTPVLLSGWSNGKVAIWEANLNGTQQLLAARVGKGAETRKDLILAEGAELPAAAISNGRALLTYVAKVGARQSIWLRSIDKFESELRTDD